MKWMWLAIGATVGFLLGARAGREQFDRLSSWTREASDQVGLSSAASQLADSAKSAGAALQDAATSHAKTAVTDVTDSVTGHLEAAANAATNTAAD
jgi:hypothetical protein